jgi:sulfonate transport system permease protein
MPITTRRRLRGLVLPILLLVLWETTSHLGWIDPRLLPPIEAVVHTAVGQVSSGHLGAYLAASLLRDLTGFLIGGAAGLAFGTLLGLSQLARGLIGPSFDAGKQIALFAWIPLISIWFGIGETAKIVFVALAAFTPVALNTFEGVRGASVKLIEVGTVLTFSRRQFVTKIFLPSALPSILVGLHLALINCWLATIATEYFMTVGPGIGGLIIEGRERFQMDLVVLGILVLGLVGFLLNRGGAAIEARLLRWQA